MRRGRPFSEISQVALSQAAIRRRRRRRLLANELLLPASTSSASVPGKDAAGVEAAATALKAGDHVAVVGGDHVGRRGVVVGRVPPPSAAAAAADAGASAEASAGSLAGSSTAAGGESKGESFRGIAGTAGFYAAVDAQAAAIKKIKAAMKSRDGLEKAMGIHCTGNKDAAGNPECFDGIVTDFQREMTVSGG
jgi:hypothetical protein